MEKEFVPYTESLELKELGFDEHCFGWYDGEYKDIINYDRTRNSCGWLNDSSCSALTFSQAFRFFREKHNLFSSEVYDRGLNNGKIPIIHSYSFRILNLNNFEDFYGNVFKTYEEAELSCLRKLIEIFKKQMIMEKEFVPFTEARELKQLGFDEPCFGYYNTMGFNRYFDNIKNSDNLIESENIKGNWCTAPTFSQAFRWFREKHDLFGIVQGKGYNHKRYYMHTINDEWHPSQPTFDIYEEAELNCLRKLIEIIKNK